MPRDAAVGRQAVMSAPSNAIAPRRGPVRAGDRAQQRRLAGAVGADQRDGLALVDRRSDTPRTACSRPWRASSAVDLEQRSRRRLAEVGVDDGGVAHAPSSGSPSAMTRPASMQTSRSTTWTSTCTMCSIQTIAMPRRAVAGWSRRSSAASASVRPPPISSSSSTCGSVASARASSRRLRCSRPRLSARRFASSISPHSSSTSMQRVVGVRPRRPRAGAAPTSTFSKHRHAAERPRDLVRAADAEPAAAARPQPGDVVAVEADGAGVGRERAGEDVEQGRLAGAVGADDADRLAGADARSRRRRAPTSAPNRLWTARRPARTAPVPSPPPVGHAL